ncbi:hypothetical protein Hanom_Chr09g00863281 [Helianthus anomalus]
MKKDQPKGDGTGAGPASASDLLILPIPQMMQPGEASAENLAPQRSQTSYPMVDKRLRVAAQNWEGSSNGSMDLLVKPLWTHMSIKLLNSSCLPGGAFDKSNSSICLAYPCWRGWFRRFCCSYRAWTFK